MRNLDKSELKRVFGGRGRPVKSADVDDTGTDGDATGTGDDTGTGTTDGV